MAADRAVVADRVEVVDPVVVVDREAVVVRVAPAAEGVAVGAVEDAAGVVEQIPKICCSRPVSTVASEVVFNK